MEFSKEVDVFFESFQKNKSLEQLEQVSKDVMKIVSLKSAKEVNEEKISKALSKIKDKDIMEYVKDKSKEHLSALSKVIQKKVSKLKIEAEKNSEIGIKIERVNEVSSEMIKDDENMYSLFEEIGTTKETLYNVLISNKEKTIKIVVNGSMKYQLSFSMIDFLLNVFQSEKSVTQCLFGLSIIDYFAHTEKDSQTMTPQEIDFEKLIEDIQKKYPQYKVTSNSFDIYKTLPKDIIVKSNNVDKVKKIIRENK